MAEVGYKSGSPVMVINTNSVKVVAATISTMTTGDILTMTGGTFKMSTIAFYSLIAPGGSTFAGTVHVNSSNVLSVNGTSGVQSCYALLVGF